MLNTGRVNAELTGISENLWALLMYISVFLIWIDYPAKSNKYLRNGLKTLGIIILIFIGLGVLCLILGFVLRNWFIISKIRATPSWGMICTGYPLSSHLDDRNPGTYI